MTPFCSSMRRPSGDPELLIRMRLALQLLFLFEVCEARIDLMGAAPW